MITKAKTSINALSLKVNYYFFVLVTFQQMIPIVDGGGPKNDFADFNKGFSLVIWIADVHSLKVTIINKSLLKKIWS